MYYYYEMHTLASFYVLRRLTNDNGREAFVAHISQIDIGKFIRSQSFAQFKTFNANETTMYPVLDA